MRRFLTTCAIIVGAVISLTAQFPNTFQYQAALRDNSGDPLINQAVTLRFTIHGGGAGGPIRYQETKNVVTNQWGIVNTSVLDGTVTIPGFINWTTETNFLQVEVNATGSFIDMGTQQILAVPYAIYAGNAQVASQVAGIELENPEPGSVITWDENQEMWVDKKIPSYWPTDAQQYMTIPGRGIWFNTVAIEEEWLSIQNEIGPVSASVDVEVNIGAISFETICSVPDVDCPNAMKLTPVQFPPNALISSFNLHGSGSVKAKLYRQHVSNPEIIELVAEDEPDTVSPFDEHLVNNTSYSYYVVVEPLFSFVPDDLFPYFHSQFTLNALQIGYTLP
ncbi:MAG: hypothetical protein JNM00_12060 [Flavobacteriales bacterium]|nr:hypothetical protein [Flavobacteriales bacterium]